jgi:hypothetical protein
MLADSTHAQVFWAAEQVRWIDTISDGVMELVSAQLEVLALTPPGSPRTYPRGRITSHKDHVESLNAVCPFYDVGVLVMPDILVPYDAEPVLTFSHAPGDTCVLVDVAMGLERWREFDVGATRFCVQVGNGVVMRVRERFAEDNDIAVKHKRVERCSGGTYEFHVAVRLDD